MEENTPKPKRKSNATKYRNSGQKNFIQLCHPSANPLSKTALSQYRHHFIPGLTLNKHIDDLQTVKDFVNFYKSPPVSITSPIPFLAPNEITDFVLKGEDPAKELVRRAFNWKLKKRGLLQTVRNACKRHPIVDLFVKESRFDQAHQREQPLGIANLAFHLSQNPDPNFKGVYNWYYGNTACTASFRGENYLLCARGKQLNELGIFDLDSGVARAMTEQDDTFAPILDISYTGDSNLVAVRRKNSCSFFELEKENDEFSMKSAFKILGEKTSFVSLACKGTEFCTVNTERVVRLWDVQSESCVSKGRLLDQGIYLSNKWMSATFHELDDNMIVVVDRTNMYWLDKRLKLSKPTYQYQVNKKAEFCEEISLLLPTVNTDRWYVALNHTFLTFDARNSESIQKWTHMMDAQPSVGHVANISSMTNSSSEMILLGTQATGYSVGIFNDISSPDRFVSKVLPYCVPNRAYAIKRARFNGSFTHRMFDEIIASSLTGLTAHQQDGKLSIFTADTTGNVYKQEAFPPGNSPKKETSRLRKMEDWEAKLCAKWRSADMEVRITDLFDMSEVMSDVRSKEGEVTTEEGEMNVEGDRRWRISKVEVESYVDLLAPVVAEHYEIYDEDEWLEKDEDESERWTQTELEEGLENRKKKTHGAHWNNSSEHSDFSESERLARNSVETLSENDDTGMQLFCETNIKDTPNSTMELPKTIKRKRSSKKRKMVD